MEARWAPFNGPVSGAREYGSMSAAAFPSNASGGGRGSTDVAIDNRSVTALWSCKRCGRKFRRANQRHSCGAGSRAALLRGKSDVLVRLYRALEKTLKPLGGVEIVARDRYVLFRTTRIFADLVFQKDALRLAVHLDREVRIPLFFKVGRDRRRVSHVAMLREVSDVRAVTPYLKEAYRSARSEERA
jgi:predicted transport protein